MEAIAVAQAISAVWSTTVVAFDVCQTLYKFCKDTRAVDENVKELSSETNSLASAYASLHRLLEGLSQEQKTLIESRDRKLCTEIGRCVEEFGRTIGELKASIKGIEKKKSDSFFGKGVRAVKLSLKKDDIRKFRERIAAHHLSVQTQIVTLNAQISLMTSTAIQSQILKSELDQLQMKAQVVQANIRSVNGRPAADISEPIEDYAVLVKNANKVLASATTVYEGSVAGSSVLGTSARNNDVAEWLGSLDTMQEERSTLERAMLPASHQFDLPQDSDDNDSDGDTFEIEIAKNAFEAAKRAVAMANYAAAKQMLLESRSVCQTLSNTQQSRVCDPWDLFQGLAICSIFIDEVPETQKMLAEFLQDAPATDKERERALDVGELLAVTHIATGDLDFALQASKNVLSGNRRVRGRYHAGTYFCLALVARLHELKDMPIRAQAYLDCIPADRRTVYAEFFQDMQPGNLNQGKEYLNRLLDQASALFPEDDTKIPRIDAAGAVVG